MTDSGAFTTMTDGDITPPPASTALRAAEPIRGDYADEARRTVREGLASFGGQAGDKAREFAETGKEKVAGLLDQLTAMLTDAAGQVDERLGAQYGDHARTAASSLGGFAQTVRDKDVDAFAEDVRDFVRKSPAAALGIAAALGFAAARAVHAGLDQRA